MAPRGKKLTAAFVRTVWRLGGYWDEDGLNTQCFYDVKSKVLSEFNPGTTDDRQKTVRACFNGRLSTSTGDATAGSYMVYTDHPGNAATEDACDDGGHGSSRLLPLGQQVNTVVDAAHDRRFTGQERDTESGLDYFEARYYHSVAGRFLSVDPVLNSADPTNPQSWNHYAYTFNNPLKYVDKTGEIVETAWDLFNVAVGVQSLIDNISAGQYGWAAVDALGVAVDFVAAAGPIVPGGAGAAIKDTRLVDKVDTDRVKSLVEQTADLVPLNVRKKHRVELRSPGQQADRRLERKATWRCFTPHAKVSQRNPMAPNQPGYNTKKAEVRPATQREIRLVRKYVEKKIRERKTLGKKLHN